MFFFRISDFWSAFCCNVVFFPEQTLLTIDIHMLEDYFFCFYSSNAELSLFGYQAVTSARNEMFTLTVFNLFYGMHHFKPYSRIKFLLRTETKKQITKDSAFLGTKTYHFEHRLLFFFLGYQRIKAIVIHTFPLPQINIR